MRLLYSHLDGEAAPILEEFYDNIPPYAILSHRWGKATEEVSFKDIETGVDISKKEGFKKLQYCCWQALEEGFDYVWIDTCCIDKSSSAELSEAINSMYNCYMLSQVCYAYLNDVSCPYSWNSENTENITAFWGEGSSFRNSAWFTRGWTLQELIAPENVKFFDKDWGFIGNKHGLANLVSEITRIDPEVLTNQAKPASVAQRMSWAAGRRTTRVEDRAYSLMGIFGVNMPPLYGEGPKAFIRLQEEIMRQSFDHSLFAWKPHRSGCGLLAESPDQFFNCHNIVPISYDQYVLHLKIAMETPEYAQTNFGTRIHLPLERTDVCAVYAAYLACTQQHETQKERSHLNSLVRIYLLKEPGTGLDIHRRYFYSMDAREPRNLLTASIQPETVYIPHAREGRFEQTPSPKLLIDLQVTTDNFDVESIYYYYGGKVIVSAKKARVAYIDIGLEPNEDAAVTVSAGYFFKSANTGNSSEQVNVYAIFGFQDGIPWTDIHVQDKGGYPILELKQLHAKYLRQRETASIHRASFTKKQWEGWPTSANIGRWFFRGSVGISEDNSQALRYRATVEFSAREFWS